MPWYEAQYLSPVKYHVNGSILEAHKESATMLYTPKKGLPARMERSTKGKVERDPEPDYGAKVYSRFGLDVLIQAAYEGDLDLLARLLDREDPIDGYHHDINAHHADCNALHAAAMNGQLEATEMLLKAKADPWVKQCMQYGKDPEDAKTAREIAEEFGWTEIVDVLKKAEEENPPGIYMRYGARNNAKLWPMEQPEGLDPEQERRAKAKYKGMRKALPTKAERKFYGQFVFGLTHGYDQDGKRISRNPANFSTNPPEMAPEVPKAMMAIEQEKVPAKAAATKIGLMFPGQGSQYVKMMQNAEDLPNVKEMLAFAEETLGYDLLKICLEGPEAKLEETSVCQPAIYISSLAAVEKLRKVKPEAVERPGAVAGLSLGEYTALTVAGCMDYKDGLRLVKIRGEAMAEAAKAPPQGMVSVAGLDRDKLEELCVQVQKSTGTTCQIANELFMKGYTCAGTKESMLMLKELADKAGALQSKLLKTSGAFHTPLMEGARKKLEAALLEMLPRLKPPRCDVYMNATGEVLREGSDPEKIVSLLCAQLTQKVRWDSCVKGMIQAGLTEFYEVGPMKQLKAMMKRIDQSMWSKTANVEI